ncbi:hypothetical protein HU200_056429 [Digitaria exilis]|uniref:Ubiquitin-like domain-containing protein n=1 Tax=Digitaria exilis TaxID=1010633 RepID=A0A835AH29_9POAL|nr:hypothetical protein HU200_056429 [Digitaria exilis]
MRWFPLSSASAIICFSSSSSLSIHPSVRRLRSSSPIDPLRLLIPLLAIYQQLAKGTRGGGDRMLGAKPKARKGAPAKLGTVTEAPVAPAAGGKGGKVPAEEVWEVRPGGMLVQKRGGGASDDEPSPNVKPVPTIRVKVKHAGVTHEIYISSEASFGELKKLVAAKTGLHPDDQKILYKDKERDSKAFLDMAGVKDRSKLVVVEDPEAKARRLIEERRNGHLEKAARAVASVTAEVDKLAPKVAALESSVRKGEKVAENDVVQVTELLMNELLKLDAVVADGDVKAQRRMQEHLSSSTFECRGLLIESNPAAVKRVQKYVETLDAVAAKNAAIIRKSGEKAKQAPPPPQQQHQQPRQQQQQYNRQQQQPAAGQTRWEMFDLLSSLPSTSSASSTTTVSSTASSGAPPPPTNRLDWMLF